MAKLIKNEATAVPTRFTSNGSTLLTKAIAAESRGRIASQKATDAMIADGMKWTDFISPNGKTTESTSTPELYTALKGAILKGLGATATKLQATPTKSLSDADKAIKDNNNKLVGRGMAAQRDAMRLRQDDDYRASKSKATTKAPQTPTGAPAKQVGVAKEVELLNRIHKVAQGKESPEYDVVALVALLSKALQIVNTPVEPKH
tara:strand:+ start:217 stop:828 length:612 start_codon:yes stop_codon:yes gene_type:complete